MQNTHANLMKLPTLSKVFSSRATLFYPTIHLPIRLSVSPYITHSSVFSPIYPSVHSLTYSFIHFQCEDAHLWRRHSLALSTLTVARHFRSAEPSAICSAGMDSLVMVESTRCAVGKMENGVAINL